jgi:hypothetical protein
MDAAALSQSMTPRPIGATFGAKVSVVSALLAGFLIRFWMLRHFFEVNGDTLVYGGIAKNLLLSSRYALTVSTGQTFRTLIRLPGYPFLLAICFRLFGIENYHAVAWFGIALDLAGSLLLADFARRIAPPAVKNSAAQGTLWLAALCPFTAVYSVNPLTEGPTLFALALALWAAACFQDHPGWGPALIFTFAVTFAALLRPDGALAAVALAPALIVSIRKSDRMGQPLRMMRIAVACALLALAPFALWTWRNWQAFHVFQPLAPRTATDPGDPLTPGWDRWVKTWCLDFVSTYSVVWNVPGDGLDVGKLPSRAFDTAGEFNRTAALAAEYNQNGWNLTPEIDRGFGQLAQERIAAHPFRFYLWLPLGRVVDMWLRPRVENLPIDLDWWVYAHHYVETRFSWAYAGLNGLYLLLGFGGLWLRPRMWVWMFLYMLLRSALLFTVVPPEARYTLECFPMLFALGGIAIAGAMRKKDALAN